VNEVDLALQPEIRVLEPAFGVRRIDGAVVILGEKVLSPATVRRAQAITFRRVCIEEFDDGLEADAVLGESDFPVDAPRNGSTSSRMTAATSSSVSVVMVSGWET